VVRPNFKVLFWHLPGGTEKKVSQDNWSLGQNLNLGPHKYEAGVLTTQLQWLVILEGKERRNRGKFCCKLFLVHCFRIRENLGESEW
jgi:hypothetical protein